MRMLTKLHLEMEFREACADKENAMQSEALAKQ